MTKMYHMITFISSDFFSVMAFLDCVKIKWRIGWSLKGEQEMKLEDCRDRSVNIAEISRKIYFSRAHISGVLSGRLKASKKLLAALDRLNIEEVRKKYGPKKY